MNGFMFEQVEERSLRTHLILFLMNRYHKYEALSRVDVPEKHGVEALVYYKMKALVALGQQADARALYDEYKTAVAHRPPLLSRGGLGQRLLRLVIGCYGVLMNRYAAGLGAKRRVTRRS